MPKNKTTGTKPVSEHKICPVCKKSKSIKTGFYKSSSPLFALDGCVPICIDCVKKEVVNEDGTVNENKLKTMCQRLDKPFYTDELDSAFLQVKSEHGYLSDDEVAKQGNKIVGFFFKNINTLRQNKDKSFADSERDGFSHKTYNVNAREKKERIANRYGDVIENTNSSSSIINTPSVDRIALDVSGTLKIQGVGGKSQDLDINKLFDTPEFRNQLWELINNKFGRGGTVTNTRDKNSVQGIIGSYNTPTSNYSLS